MEDEPSTLIAALEHAPSGMAVLADDGRIEWVNRRMGRLLRHDRDALVGSALGELIHPEDFVPTELDLAELVPERIHDLGRKRFVRPDGSTVWTGLTVTRFASGGGSHLVANVFDLTELVFAEARLASVVEGLDDAVVSIDSSGRIAVANPAAQKLLGSLGAPLIGLDLGDVPWEVLDETGEPLAPAERPELVALASGQPAFATTGLRGGDETRWVEVAAHPLVRSGERYVAATYKDVSERLRIEAALKDAEAADRAKSEFLSRMSHELRTPLNSVLGFAQLLQIDELAAGQQEAVDQILRAGRHLLGLLDEVLDLERMQSGQFETRVTSVAITPVLQEAVELVQPLAVARGVAIDVRVGRDAPAHVLADEQRLRQVLLNLLTNGVKFNRPHGRVTVSCQAVNETMVIRVRDTGQGIAAGDVDHIFMPFERLDADRRGIEGAGVGLALAKRLTEAMGGAIGVESEPGVGSTFFLVLRTTGPEAKVVDPPAPVSPELLPELLRRTDPTRRRVLYIEDNAESRTLMERIADLHGGIDLTTAPTAGEGLERARAINPDAILLDLHLPDGSGDEVVESLKRDPATRDTPVIILTADATPQRRERLTASGAVAYLMKPVDLSELFAALEVALEPHP
ncbi:MAG: PAS domain-containing hybrid sensor histidine kinase/response regulator [Acidimicrobiia bacterium]